MALTRAVKAGFVTAAVTLAVGMLALNQALVGVFYDDGLYASLASAVASGYGYVHPSLPGMPGGVHFPPVYPIVLAPVFGLLPVPAAALAAKILNALLAAAAAGLIAWHALRTELLGPGLPRWVPAAVVAAAAIAIPVLATQTVLFAEPLFGLLVAIVIVLVDSLPAFPLSTEWRGGQAVRAGIVAALALLTRSIGIAVVIGTVCFLLARRPPLRVWSALLLPPVIAFLAWGIWVATHAGRIDPALALVYGTYGAPLREAGFSAISGNVRDLSRPLEVLAFGWITFRPLYVLLATAALAVGLYGLFLVSRRSAIGWSLIFYLLILAVWPYPPDRFIWVILPWLALTWAAGAAELWRRWPSPRARILVGLLAALGAGGYLRYEFQGFKGRWWDSQARAISANFAELLPVVQNLPDTAIVATDDEALVWLYTRRRAVPLYLESYRGRELIRPTPAEHRAYFERMGVTHVLLASATSPSAIELRSLLGAYPSWLTAIYRWSDGRWLFALNRGQ